MFPQLLQVLSIFTSSERSIYFTLLPKRKRKNTYLNSPKFPNLLPIKLLSQNDHSKWSQKEFLKGKKSKSFSNHPVCIHCVYIVSPWTDWMRMGQPWDVSIPDVGQGFSQWREGSGRDSKIEIVRAAALVLELWSYCPHPRNSLASVSLSTTFFLSTFSPKLALFPNNRRSFTKFNHWKSCAGEDDSEHNFYQHSLSHAW